MFIYTAVVHPLEKFLFTRQPFFMSEGLYGLKHTVQEYLLHHDRHGVLFFIVMEKGLFIVQMIKSTINNICMRGQDN